MNIARAPFHETLARVTLPTVVAVFAIVGLVLLWRVLATIGLRVPLDPNEGWNAYHAAAAMAGHALYPRSSFVNNYPPLSFYVVGALGRIVGDQIVAGRLVSLFAFFFIAGGIAKVAERMGCRAIEGAMAAVFFMAWLLIGSDYVGMNDPQLLGQALEMGALLLVFGARGRDVAAAFVFVAALFVKHNLAAMPAAVALWLFLEDRARALRFIASGAAFALLGLVVFRLAFGTSLLSHLVSARTYSLALAAENTRAWLVWGAVPLAITGALAFFRRDDRFVVFCALYAGLGVAIGVAFSGGAGVDANVFFDADIALSLGLALALNRFASRAFVAATLLLPLAFGLYQASDETWRDPDYWLHPMADSAAIAKDDIGFLEARQGRALCETLSLCYWAGKTAEVDTFNVGQEFATGTRSDDDLVRLIHAHAYSTLEFETLEPFALGPRVMRAVLASYRVDHKDDLGVYFVPR